MTVLMLHGAAHTVASVTRYWSPCRCENGRHARDTRGSATVVRAKALDDLRPGEHLVHWYSALSAIEEVAS